MEVSPIRLVTKDLELLLKVAPSGRLCQSYFGAKVSVNADEFFPVLNKWSVDFCLPYKGFEVCLSTGMEDYFEPCLQITHNDGTMTTELKYVTHTQTSVGEGRQRTEIVLEDKLYPITVKVIYETFFNENVFVQHMEITHKEKEPIDLVKYNSSILYFNAESYTLNEYAGDWASEGRFLPQKLVYGKKVVEANFGSRAALFSSPYFEVGLGSEPQEKFGEVLVGTIAWTGNYRFTFEVDNMGNLRVISGINPRMSTYHLKPEEVFVTPDFIYTLGLNGTSKASRDMHDWARKYRVKDGMGDRLTLLNNWETTFFDFDEKKLADLMKEAKDLGVDMFLLDDGWFGNKYPRINDKAGLGDWEPMKCKLPNGISYLTKVALEAGIKFGLWIEPEMVNPKSELYENHPDWAIFNQDRTPFYHRNQLVLDLSNPDVQDYVFGIIDKLKTENSDISYFKWDCNSIMTNLYSKYQGRNQSHIYVDHVRGYYNVCKRVKAKYPELRMMLCSGGGGRCDYEALKYYTEFWASDNTNPIERLYMQWAYSKVFPVKSIASHVTEWNKAATLKFKVDVSSTCKLGFDIDPSKLTADEKTFCREAVGNFNALKSVILDGDLYRLVSPYSGNHCSVQYVSKDGNKGVLFAFDMFPAFGENIHRVKLDGLDPSATYRLEEINMMPGQKSSFDLNGQSVPGDYLMKFGVSVFSGYPMTSKVITLTKL
jgi:alpha-galactosidase